MVSQVWYRSVTMAPRPFHGDRQTCLLPRQGRGIRASVAPNPRKPPPGLVEVVLASSRWPTWNGLTAGSSPRPRPHDAIKVSDPPSCAVTVLQQRGVVARVGGQGRVGADPRLPLSAGVGLGQRYEPRVGVSRRSPDGSI